MQLYIHLTDGSIIALEQSDPALANPLVEHLNPHQIFAQPRLVIIAGGAMSVFPTAAIVRIDLIPDQDPHWQLGPEVVDMRGITADEFQERRNATSLASPRGPFTVIIEVAVTGSAPLLIEMLIQPPLGSEDALPNPIDLALLLNRRLAAPIFFRRHGEGITLLNPAHIIRFSTYPAPQIAPPGVWQAEHIGVAVG